MLLKERVIYFSPPTVDLVAAGARRQGPNGGSDNQNGKIKAGSSITHKNCLLEMLSKTQTKPARDNGSETTLAGYFPAIHWQMVLQALAMLP